MSDTQNPDSVIRFGNFEVNLQSREFRKSGMRLRLEQKPFQILEMLTENAGQVVRRAALCERLWPDTHVAFEHSLNTAVNKLRDQLGDSAQNPRFVETIPRLGYRFVAPVERPGQTRLAAIPASPEDVAATPLTCKATQHLTVSLVPRSTHPQRAPQWIPPRKSGHISQ